MLSHLYDWQFWKNQSVSGEMFPYLVRAAAALIRNTKESQKTGLANQSYSVYNIDVEISEICRRYILRLHRWRKSYAKEQRCGRKNTGRL